LLCVDVIPPIRMAALMIVGVLGRSWLQHRRHGRAHRGSLSCTSTGGAGSVFRIRLPLFEEPDALQVDGSGAVPAESFPAMSRHASTPCGR
jgi:hypothetical protein